MDKEIKLRYIGKGTFLPPHVDEKGEEVPGVPARDLTEAEARFHGGIVYLIKSGLYERVEDKGKPHELEMPKKDGK
jgi:hypothetical protein